MELSDIKGVGPKMLGNLKTLNINNMEDLLSYYPYRYDIFEPINLDENYNGERVAINVIVETTATTAFIKRNFNKLQFSKMIGGIKKWKIKYVKVVVCQ